MWVSWSWCNHPLWGSFSILTPLHLPILSVAIIHCWNGQSLFYTWFHCGTFNHVCVHKLLNACTFYFFSWNMKKSKLTKDYLYREDTGSFWKLQKVGTTPEVLTSLHTPYWHAMHKPWHLVWPNTEKNLRISVFVSFLDIWFNLVSQMSFSNNLE